MTKWEKIRDEMANYTKYFDSTIDKEYYLRPKNWFELDYDVKC